MSVFENISDLAVNAAQKARKSLETAADQAKIRSRMAQEQKKINVAHLKMGRLYEELHGADGEEAFASLLSDLKQARLNLRDCTRQMDEARGVVLCPHCGARMENTAAYCSSCGSRMPGRETAQEEDFQESAAQEEDFQEPAAPEAEE